MTLPMYTFNNTIPATDNNPSADQPEMKNNNIAAPLALAADHIPYGVAGTGYHQQARIKRVNPKDSVPVVIAGYGGVYTNEAGSDAVLTETNLYYTPDAGAQAYQLTRTISAKFANFAKNIAVASQTGGWTFLPGGLLMLYGTVDPVSSLTNVVNFASLNLPDFNNVPFNVQVTTTRATSNPPGNVPFIWVPVDTVATTGFTIKNTTGVSFGYFWTAIGV